MIWSVAGDCRTILAALPESIFDCVVTSPPYWGLRDYGIEGQIGLEPTLDAYVETMRDVARALWRVLKPKGTFWLNLGDSYNNFRTQMGPGQALHGRDNLNGKPAPLARQRGTPGLKEKDLCGVPWRVAFALQADGWWLRSAVVWAKPNPMPESVTDRPTSAYEMVFLLTKAERYFYDAEAIKEDAVAADLGEMDGGAQRCLDGSNANMGRNFRPGKSGNKARTYGGSAGKRPDDHLAAGVPWEGFTRNARNVWTIATQPFKGSHFATMPPAIADRCIRAGCPKGGIVLDPFSGAGTTGLVADRLGRHAALIDLNPDYCAMGKARIESAMKTPSPLRTHAPEAAAVASPDGRRCLSATLASSEC